MKTKVLLVVLATLVALPWAAPFAKSADGAQILLSDTQIALTAKQGEKGTATISVSNKGGVPLLFALSKSYSKPKTPASFSPQGTMVVNPTYLDFGTVPTRGQVTQTLTATAPGEQYLQIQATSDVPWIKTLVRNIQPTIATITVTVTLDDLVSGQLYRANVILGSNAGVLQVPVILQVATSEVRDWLSFTPTSGLVSPNEGQTIAITANTAGLKPGEYNATLIVTSNDPAKALTEVPVKFTVLAGAPPPTAPDVFVAYPGDNRVHLFWSPVTSANAAGYYIFRTLVPGNYIDVPITDFFLSGQAYTDPNVQNGMTYYYVIRAADANGNMSDPSKEISIKPGPVTPVINLRDGLVTRNQVLDVTGIVESNSQVVVQGELALVNPDGKFQAKVVLKNGANTVSILTLDPGGGQKTFTFKVNFSVYTSIILMVGFKDATINGVVVKNAMPQPPTILVGKTMVPFRFLGENLGAEIIWEEATKKVTYKLEGKTVEMWIGNKSALVGGKLISVDPPPTIVKGSTMVPIRFISENLGASVEWKAASKTVIIKYPSAQ